MFERFQENVSLADYTTMGVGGPARWLYECENPEELPDIVAAARRESVPLAILGGGSNLLYPDEGFPGIILKVAWRGWEILADHGHGDHTGENKDGTGENDVIVRASAGEVWDDFVQHCIGSSLAGVECLSGIPGLVGAVPIQNVGAYGQEVSSAIVGLRAFDLSRGEFKIFTPEECDFAYRASRFKYADKGRFIITRVDFRLLRNGRPVLRYGELRDRFAEGGPPGDSTREKLSAVRDAVLELRRGKGMVVDPRDPDSRSCGSFFTNPVIASTEYQEFKRHCLENGIEPGSAPAFPQGDSMKLSAAWLVEQAGFHKGLARNEAGVSSKHSLALINRGHARTSEILSLAREIQAKVLEKFGVGLEREPVLQEPPGSDDS